MWNISFYLPSLPSAKILNLYPVFTFITVRNEDDRIVSIMEDKRNCNVLLYSLFTITSLCLSIRQKCLLVPILILLLFNTCTLSQAMDKCSDDTFARHFNCSSNDCVYGEESLVSCILPASIKDISCEVFNWLSSNPS